MNITITITDQEYAVLESWLGVGEVEKWVQHALNNRLRKLTNYITERDTDMNPKKMDMTAKLSKIQEVKDKAKIEVV